jgi:hypothetical protein
MRKSNKQFWNGNCHRINDHSDKDPKFDYLNFSHFMKLKVTILIHVACQKKQQTKIQSVDVKHAKKYVGKSNTLVCFQGIILNLCIRLLTILITIGS